MIIRPVESAACPFMLYSTVRGVLTCAIPIYFLIPQLANLARWPWVLVGCDVL